jgi:hypothetical protein
VRGRESAPGVHKHFGVSQFGRSPEAWVLQLGINAHTHKDTPHFEIFPPGYEKTVGEGRGHSVALQGRERASSSRPPHPPSAKPPRPQAFGFALVSSSWGPGGRQGPLWSQLGRGPGNLTAASWERSVPFPGAQRASGRGQRGPWVLFGVRAVRIPSAGRLSRRPLGQGNKAPFSSLLCAAPRSMGTAAGVLATQVAWR